MYPNIEAIEYLFWDYAIVNFINPLRAGEDCLGAGALARDGAGLGCPRRPRTTPTATSTTTVGLHHDSLRRRSPYFVCAPTGVAPKSWVRLLASRPSAAFPAPPSDDGTARRSDDRYGTTAALAARLGPRGEGGETGGRAQPEAELADAREDLVHNTAVILDWHPNTVGGKGQRVWDLAQDYKGRDQADLAPPPDSKRHANAA